MLILSLLLWTMAIILLFTSRDEESTRWGSGIAIFSGCGGFAVAIEENILPFRGGFVSKLNQEFNIPLGSIDSTKTSPHEMVAFLLYGAL